MPDTPPEKNAMIHTIWGVALVAMGIGVFFRIPQVMPKIAEIDIFSSATVFIRFCFYFLGVSLVYGGGRKLYRIYGRQDSNQPDKTH